MIRGVLNLGVAFKGVDTDFRELLVFYGLPLFDLQECLLLVVLILVVLVGYVLTRGVCFCGWYLRVLVGL